MLEFNFLTLFLLWKISAVFLVVLKYTKTQRLGQVGLQHHGLPNPTGAAARRGQDPSRGPLRDVVVNLSPLKEKIYKK